MSKGKLMAIYVGAGIIGALGNEIYFGWESPETLLITIPIMTIVALIAAVLVHNGLNLGNERKRHEK